MTTKFKILSSVAFIALAIVLTFVGVWALTDLDFTVGGNITYTAPKPSITLYWDSANSYWYVKMGSTGTISEIKWRLVGLDGERYTSSTKPTSGKGTFILETYVPATANSKYYVFDKTNYVNDYSNSDIRKYLTGDYLTFLNLTNDATYKAITPRSITDLHTDIGWATGNVGGEGQYDPPAGTTQYATYDTTPSNATGSDSLWLMSVKEVYTLLGGGTIGSDGTISNTWSQDVKDGCNWDAENTIDYYWLRSPLPGGIYGAFFVYNDGSWFERDVDFAYGVRPAFNLVF